MKEMKQEIDARLAIGIITIVLIILGALAWWKFWTPQGTMTAAQAGLGKPMYPGEIPGKRSEVPGVNFGVPMNR
ncbi:MAG TPA: hypothetical protein VNJ09_06990 [Chthonomonadales bacterium]|nr:hypothetical protein [Chthonomonadales bacterium]